ncbi:MAG TPA: ribonuclease P protein component, partial [Planctomycetota bacterium]|nr:ribonuclease P protein component [Planctomycetota bacterium]
MKAHGLAKRERLTRRRDFEAVYAAKRSAADERLVVCVRANDLGLSRIGRSVAGKWGNACRRNRFRRLVVEAFRL